MKRRIFIALPISASLQEEIARFSKIYRNLPARWLAGKNIHITLIPPWHEENVTSVSEKLQSLHGTTGSFHATFDHVSFGPNPRRPRLIWATGEAPPPAINLKRSLENLLSIQKENRPFLLHLTIARFRQEQFRSFPIHTLDEKVRWEEQFDSFVLMESHLSPKGADYEILTRVAL